MNWTAVGGLKDTPFFRNASLRLLADLVELGELVEPEDTSFVDAEVGFAVVLDGHLTIATGAAPQRLTSGQVFWGEAPTRNERLEVRDRSAHGARYLKFGAPLLDQVRQASPSLYASLELDEGSQQGPTIPLAQFVYVAERPRLGAPLEAVTQLLAAAVARRFGERTGLVVAREQGVEAFVWDKDHFASRPLAVEGEGLSSQQVSNLFGPDLSDRLHHVFCVDPAHPSAPRPGGPFRSLGFHRIAFLADRLPRRVPDGLAGLLTPGVFPGGAASEGVAPLFSAFVPAILVGPRSRRPRFQSERIPLGDDRTPVDEVPEDAASVPRLRRDACRIRLDLAALKRGWQAQPAGPEGAGGFATTVFADRPELEASVSRWARALTNRRVGLALSGGGASAFRMVPLLWQLHRWQVPVDVLSGVSGGALVGAYYCRDGLDGLVRCLDNGWVFQAVVLASSLRSEAIQRWVDWDLGGATLDQLEAVFLPLTTALRKARPPEARVVVGGTLGEGVQVSGSAPVMFAPTTKRDATGEAIRYVDGAAAAVIPVRVLPDFGADLVFACNVVAGPARRNPFATKPWGKLLYRTPWVGRLIDLWVSGAFAAQQVSRQAAEEADDFYEPLPQDEPGVEMFLFKDAERIVEAAATDHLKAKAEDFRDRWLQFIWS